MGDYLAFHSSNYTWTEFSFALVFSLLLFSLYRTFLKIINQPNEKFIPESYSKKHLYFLSLLGLLQTSGSFLGMLIIPNIYLLKTILMVYFVVGIISPWITLIILIINRKDLSNSALG